MHPAARIPAAIAAALCLAGCAMSRQSFRESIVDRELSAPDANGAQHVTSLSEHVIQGRNRTLAPPFGARAVADHDMSLTQQGESWLIEMGSRSDLEGGELTSLVRELGVLVHQVRQLVMVLQPATAPAVVLEDLKPP